MFSRTDFDLFRFLVQTFRDPLGNNVRGGLNVFIGEMGIAGSGLHLGMAEQLCDLFQ